MNRCKILKIIVIVNLLLLSSLVNLVGLAKAAAVPSGEMTELSVTKLATGLENVSLEHTTLTHQPTLSLPPAIPPQRPLLNGTSILTITTTANPTSIDEPGGVINYTVSVTNTTVTTDITITALIDNSGDLNGQGCSTPQVLTPTQNYTCNFTATVSGNAGQSKTNTVTATAQYSGTNQAEASDEAAVTITDVSPDITVQKDNDANGDLSFTDNEQAPAGGATVTFRAIITNNTNENVTIDSISDDHYTPLTSTTYSPNCTSLVSTTLTANDTVTCYFDGTIPNDDNLNEVNTLTVNVSDDEGNNAPKNDTSTVTTPDILPDITVQKDNDANGDLSFTDNEQGSRGATVTFRTIITNNTNEQVTIDSISDDIYGTNGALTGSTLPTCASLVGDPLAANSTVTCYFDKTIPNDDNLNEVNTITVNVSDDDTNSTFDDDTSTVTTPDEDPDTEVTKKAEPASMLEPGGSVNFTVRIRNFSDFEPVTITGLIDSVHGDLNNPGDCPLPQTVDPDSVYECIFSRTVSGNSGHIEVDQITASIIDDDGNEVNPVDSAFVVITGRPPSIDVSLTADPTSVSEPSGTVEFTLRVDNNSSATDPVTINSIIDSIYGDLDITGDCPLPQPPIPAGGSYECIFSKVVSGDPGDSQTNEVTVNVTDDDGTGLQENDDATVTITDVPSSISVNVTPNPSSIPEPGGTIAFTVRVDNTLSVDSVDINDLTDSVYGDLDGLGLCPLETIPAGGFYECTFNGDVNGNSGDSQTNTITVEATDDDGVDLQENGQATVNITDKPTFTVYLPIILKAPPTELSVWNDKTGGNVTFTVLGTNPLVSCTVPNNTTQFCGSFTPGTYTVQVTSTCGNGQFSKTYGSGPQTTRVFCN